MVLEKIISLLASQLDVDRELIAPDTDIIDDLGADSLDIVELINSIEDEFNILITDEKAMDIRTVNDLVGYIEKYI